VKRPSPDGTLALCVAGTALAAQALQEFEDFDTKAAAKRNITTAIERVAKRLGNTKAVCRKIA
jgi:DNA topoisomerase-1